MPKAIGGVSYMNPAPPVIMIVPTSGNGLNLVVPASTGASFQISEKSSSTTDNIRANVRV